MFLQWYQGKSSSYLFCLPPPLNPHTLCTVHTRVVQSGRLLPSSRLATPPSHGLNVKRSHTISLDMMTWCTFKACISCFKRDVSGRQNYICCILIWFGITTAAKTESTTSDQCVLKSNVLQVSFDFTFSHRRDILLTVYKDTVINMINIQALVMNNSIKWYVAVHVSLEK